MVSEWIGADQAGAVFDETQQYRYSLWRRWNPPNPAQPSICSDMLLWLMLNPSTADQYRLDPTITRCMGFSKDWGFNGLIVANLFAYRATDPRAMKAHKEPIGERNDEAIDWLADHCGQIVCAWGNHGSYRHRAGCVMQRLNISSKLREKTDLICHLGLSGQGQPKHPLYLPASTTRTVWRPS